MVMKHIKIALPLTLLATLLSGPAAAVPAAVPAVAEWTVTLLTGDKVRVIRDGSGRYAAEPAATTHAASVTAVGEHLYVIPASVATLVPRRRRTVVPASYRRTGVVPSYRRRTVVPATT
jgi:hypothetical protein